MEKNNPTDKKVIVEKIEKGQVKVKTQDAKSKKNTQVAIVKKDAKEDNVTLQALRQIFEQQKKPVTSTQLKDAVKAKTRGVVRRQMQRLAKAGSVKITVNGNVVKGKPKYLYAPA